MYDISPNPKWFVFRVRFTMRHVLINFSTHAINIKLYFRFNSVSIAQSNMGVYADTTIEFLVALPIRTDHIPR